MNYLLRTTAIVAVLGGFGMAAHAQQTDAMDANYCDKPWAQVDGNSDGFVSESEASSAIENQFGQIDLDGNGEITKTEWVDCMSKMRGQTTAEADRSDQNFAEADVNQDEQIDRDEFRQGSQQAYEDAQANNANDDSMIVLRRYIFLTPQESQDQTAMQTMSADEAAGRSALSFSALDSNGDDKIDSQEWSERSPKLTRDEEWASAEFDRLDEDANGSVNQDEYQSARQQMLDEMSTGSTTKDGSASTQPTEASGEASSQSSNSDKGIPVYIYRFSTF
mgnify:CR=1 FL=1|tara:strand:- start:3901 stop:4734 length:834 start_codon:yes stop_codon:yes gene_type:complete